MDMDLGGSMWNGMIMNNGMYYDMPPAYSYYPFVQSNSEMDSYQCSSPQSSVASGSFHRSNSRSSLSSVSSKSSNISPMLPPCRVCGEKASGFHYGVNTCEACKGFFRRSMHKTDKYKCIGDGDCEIVSSRRGTCSACRYNKCIAVGMSKEAIKTGRYTHEKRAKDIAEVKRLEQMQVEVHQQLPRQPVVMETTSIVAMIPSSSEYEVIVERITCAHIQHAQNILAMITERENEYLEQRALKESLFGRLKPIPADEYMKIYEMTGMDVDGRRDLIEGILPYMESRIKDFVTFAKAAPLFGELPVDDQISIIKSSRFQVWLILNHQMWNQQQRLYTTLYGKVICEEEMMKLHDAVYVERAFDVNKLIRALKLDYREMCVLAAFVMMSPDRCVLLERRCVEQSQSMLVNCLQYLFAKLRPNEPLAFAHVISVLLELRCVQHLHEKEEEKLAIQWFDKIQFPPLVYEMWSS